MNTIKLVALVIAMQIIALFSPTTVAVAQIRKATTTPSPVPKPNTEMLDLLRRAEQAATQAQAEAQRAREQNEELQRRLTQNTEELTRLRQVIADFGAQLATLRENKAKTETVTTQLAVVTETQKVTEAEQQKLQTEIETIKEQSDVHTAQLKEHAQTKVETASKTRVKLYGTILANTYFNTRDSSLTDVPLFAPAPSSTVRKNNVGGTLRQSKFGFIFNGPTLGDKLGGARASAEAEFDFWGGPTDEVTGMLRIVTASARLDWDHTSLVAGQRPPLISPRNPSSIAAVWFPAFTAAGNLWQWRPQITVEHRLKMGEANEWQLQGGLMTPFGENVQGNVIEGGPGYEARLGFTHTLASEQPLEFGVGSFIHRRSFAFNRNVTAFAVTGDWAVPLGEKIEISGEAFFGRANNLGDAGGFRADRHFATTGILTNANSLVRGVFAVGGWTQLKLRARPDLDFNLAYGQEDPRNRDLRFGQPTGNTRYKNQSASANFIWNWRQNFLLSLEYRRFWTNYSASQQKSGHYNLAIGYTF